jgi:uncharacterized DUF497 family protein
MNFEWNESKNITNFLKHGVSFEEAQYAFLDSKRIILNDVSHSTESEKRYYCLGKYNGNILTVRFTYRSHIIRIYGAGYWRKGKAEYEKQNCLH